MAQRKSSDEKQAEKANEQVQKVADEETSQGFRGTKVDPRENSEYSLESGPDSPSALDQNVDAIEQRLEAAKASAGEN